MAEISEVVRDRLTELGDEGERWRQSLDARITELERSWDCHIGEPMSGGSAAFVAHAVDRSGHPAVVKISIPTGGTGYSGYERELDVLTTAGPVAYVAVLEHDAHHRAMLLERLAAPLADLGLDVAQQIDVLAQTIAAGWCATGPASSLPSGAQQLEWLSEFIIAEVARSSGVVEPPTFAKAQEFIGRPRAAFDLSRCVLIHGDAHPTNVLASVCGGFKLIDPEGLISEREHDLAIPLRGWVDELLTDDAASSAANTAATWCQQLADRAGVDVDAIWEWAFIERVSTGLLLSRLSSADGPRYLRTADLLRNVRW